MPIVEATFGNRRCLDLGYPASVFVTHPASLQERAGDPGPGSLYLGKGHLTIGSHLPNGQEDRMYWDLKTGALIDLESDYYVAIRGWALGVIGTDGKFVRQVSFPEDYQ